MPHGTGLVEHDALKDLHREELEAAIIQQREFFADRDQAFDWLVYDDHPLLAEQLRAAGLHPFAQEIVMAGEAIVMAVAPRLLEGVQLRQVDTATDVARVRDMCADIAGAEVFDSTGLTDSTAVVVAEIGNDIVAAGSVQFHDGTDFASLTSSATLPRWRRLGLYRAIASRRAAVALGRGHQYVHAHCPTEAASALTGIGMVPIATVTRYRWTPAEG